MPDPATTVTALLAAAGVSPDPDEVEALIANYPAHRADVDLIYTVPAITDGPLVQGFSLAEVPPPAA